MLILGEKMLMSVELKECVYMIYVFLIFFRCITVPNFITVGYVWQILRSRTFFDHPSVSSPEKARPEKLKNNYFLPHLSSGKSGINVEVWSFQKFKDVYPLQTMISMMKLFFWQIWATNVSGSNSELQRPTKLLTHHGMQ